MSPQQIRCKGKESKNENDISAVCLLRKYFFSQGWFWLMKKTCFTNWTFCLVPQTLRPLGFFANIKNPATSGTKELNRSLFAETEKPPCASSNQKEINHTLVLLAAWQRVWEWSRGGWWAGRGRARDRPFDGGHDAGGDGDDGDDGDDGGGDNSEAEEDGEQVEAKRETFCKFAIHIPDVGLLFVMMTMISKLDAPNGQQGCFLAMVMNLAIFRVLFLPQQIHLCELRMSLVSGGSTLLKEENLSLSNDVQTRSRLKVTPKKVSYWAINKGVVEKRCSTRVVRLKNLKVLRNTWNCFYSCQIM